MSYDAKKAAYQEVTILGRPALFAECRIDNSTVPKGLYRYELRHATRIGVIRYHCHGIS